MVRVISQGFSTPRSRHSSGEEMIDRFAAMKALGALQDEESTHSLKHDFVTKHLVIDCCTDTTDSFSGMESEDDNRVYNTTGDLQNNNIIHQVTVQVNYSEYIDRHISVDRGVRRSSIKIQISRYF